MKFRIVFAAGLLFAGAAQAQSTHQIISNAAGSAGASFGGGFGGGAINSAGGHPVAYEAPRQFAVGYATNDGPFVPSTFMNYEDALALGKQMLSDEEEARAGRGPLSVAGAARINKAAKASTSRPGLRILQDSAGKLQVCDSDGKECHRLKSRALLF